MNRMDYTSYIADRNEAFLSMDAARIAAHCRRWGIRMPENPVIFWAGIHKARLMIEDFPSSERAASRAWLMDHGFYREANAADMTHRAPQRVYRHASRLRNLRESLSFHMGRLAAAVA